VDSTGSERHHIHIVCNNPQVLAEVKQELRGYFSVGISASPEATVSALEVSETSAVVICIGDDRKEAFDLFVHIFDTIKRHNIPVIFLAERGNDEDETAAFEMGAVDYSARRHGTAEALIKRILLRIQANEYKNLLEHEEAAAHPVQTPETALSGKTILVAEDVELNRDILSAMLSGIEDLVLEFSLNGKEALEMFQKKPDKYSLILMDVQMPVMDGLEATRAIRSIKSEHSKQIPIIALTAGVQDDEIATYLNAGMNDYIEKPFDYNNLLNVVFKHNH